MRYYYHSNREEGDGWSRNEYEIGQEDSQQVAAFNIGKDFVSDSEAKLRASIFMARSSEGSDEPQCPKKKADLHEWL